ncbi:MAG: DNA gyrase/topoisomerase IV subunit A [Ancrocorticia sp.]|uniref:DNA gyrase/topoisomerase IV subunit A n=1 Tax=Ancrocorticia sp. TaxID=2593684 RepID=UPI003F926539
MRHSAADEIEEKIVDIDVSTEMRTSFLEYSYSVIYARALPDARDGLKPVQRRILFQMDQMGLRPDKGHVKSSRVVGDVMGKLHPHGDVAIYDATVRMAQSFTMRLPLVDGHGNFGSLDDGPAAARYTEVRMAPAALAMTNSLDEDVVEMVPNYDNTLSQPSVLPAAIPNLLVNGASGIAVGMATNMPPHNLVEVVAGAQHLLKNPDATLEDLMRFIPGPDLPEGGRIVGLDPIRQAYETGRGIFKTRATASIENVTARKKGIVFTELPYLVGPEKIIEKLKDAITAKKISGVSAVHNLTDRHNGMRLVVELKHGFNPEAVLEQLYKFTPLEDSFGINNVALVEGQPRTLGLKELLQVFLDHRVSVVRRRSQFRLDKATKDLHLIDGLLVAVLNIDEVIAVIRSSDDTAAARARLQQVFDLSEPQADYILELRLRRLTKFSQIELEQRRQELLNQISELEKILSSQDELHHVVSAEMDEVATAFGTPRRTVLVEADGTQQTGKGAMPLELADDPCWVLLSATGLIARTSEAPSREGARSRHDGIRATIASTVRGQIGVITNQGNLHRLDALLAPSLPSTNSAPSLRGGAKLHELLTLAPREKPLTIVSLEEGAPIALATAQGKIKRITPTYPNRESFEVVTLAPGDFVVGAHEAGADDAIVLVTSDAQLLRFSAQAVRAQGRAGQGIAGMRLAEGAKVLCLGVVPADDLAASFVVTVSGNTAALDGTMAGSAKVTPLDRFPAKGRGTGGVRAQRFVRGEDCLQLAYVGPEPLRAMDSAGKPCELPELDERRDASGTPLSAVISAIG